jgi:hypothetical protein
VVDRGGVVSRPAGRVARDGGAFRFVAE